MTASDAFTGAPSTNWVNQQDTLISVSNHAVATTPATELFAYYAGTWANDHESYATVTETDASFLGVTSRASATGGARNAYMFITDCASFTALYKCIAGTNTLISSTMAHPATASVIKIRSVGSTHICYDDSTILGTFTDTALGSGHPGVYEFLSASNAVSYLDDWNGADVGSTGGGDVDARLIGGDLVNAPLFLGRLIA